MNSIIYHDMLYIYISWYLYLNILKFQFALKQVIAPSLNQSNHWLQAYLF